MTTAFARAVVRYGKFYADQMLLSAADKSYSRNLVLGISRVPR